MIAAGAVLALWALAAHFALTRVAIRGRSIRAVLSSALACACAATSAQALSLFGALTPIPLGLTAAGLALGGWLLAGRPRPTVAFRGGAPGELTGSSDLKGAPRWPWVAGGGVLVAFHVLALANHPSNDIYHLEMPYYWVQHQTIAPFPSPNGRVTAFAFLTETLRIPFLLYARVDSAHLWLTSAAMVLVVAMIAELAEGLGATPAAAQAAALVGASATPLLVGVSHGALEGLLGSAWLAGSLLLLFRLGALSPGAPGSVPTAAASVFLLLMAIGAKNPFALLMPPYAIAAVLVLGRRVLDGPLLRAGVAAAAVGVLTSGIAWNYGANLLAYGDLRGPAAITAHLASATPASLWTQVLRGLAFFNDWTWLPSALQPALLSLTNGLLRLLGAADALPSDLGFYGFDASKLPLRHGLGPAGPLLVVPAVMLAVFHAVHPHGNDDPQRAKRIRALLLVAIGGFVTFHAVLRSQSIGLFHLLLPAIAVAAPLCARLFEGRSLRWAGLGLAALNAGMLALLALGLAARKHDWTDPLSMRLRALQHDHSETAVIHGSDRTSETIAIREAYSRRELYALLMPRIEPGSVIGLVAGPNAEGYFAAGPRLKNHVVPLVDVSAPELLRPPPLALDYMIVEGETPVWRAQFKGINIDGQPFFDATIAGQPSLTAYRVH